MQEQRRTCLGTPNRTQQFDDGQRDLVLVALEPLANRCHRCAIELADVIVSEVEEVNAVFLEQIEERLTVGHVLFVRVEDKGDGNEQSQGGKEPGQGHTFQNDQQEGAGSLPEGHHHGRVKTPYQGPGLAWHGIQHQRPCGAPQGRH